MHDTNTHVSLAALPATMARAAGAFAFVGALLFAEAAFAEEASIDGYCARIGEKDHFASDGFKLKDAAAIIRQDRANYHALGVRDSDDESDKSFASKSDRVRLETMLKTSKIAPDVKDEIVNGTPFICVNLYASSIEVQIAAQYPFIGAWTCGGKPFIFTPTVYNDGSKDQPVHEIQEGSDGSYTLFLSEEVFVTLSDFSKTTMNWYSPATDKKLACTRS